MSSTLTSRQNEKQSNTWQKWYHIESPTNAHEMLKIPNSNHESSTKQSCTISYSSISAFSPPCLSTSFLASIAFSLMACRSASPSGFPKTSVIISHISSCNSSPGNLPSISSTIVFRFSGLVGLRLRIMRNSALVKS